MAEPSNDGGVPGLLAELARAGVRLRLVGADGLAVSAPPGGLPAGLRDRLSRHKSELVTWLRRPAEAAVGVVADPEHRYDPFAPSDLQQSFLIGSQAGFEHPVWPHQYMEFEKPGLDPARWEAALNRALRRQRDNLVVLRDDLMLQAVRDPEPVRVPVTDLRGRPPSEVESALAATRARMSRREPPLDRWPWLDVEITRFGVDDARLHWNNNNFFSDAAGTFRLLRAIDRLYAEPGCDLPELTVSYRDCLSTLAGLAHPDAYWTDRLADWPDAPALPVVSTVDTKRRSTLERREWTLPAAGWASLKRRGRDHGLTPSSVATAAYAEVVSVWSGSSHFLVNHMVTRRLPRHPQIGEVLGNFAGLYPLEVDWRAGGPFAERARRLQARVQADLAHLHWGGAQVLQALNRQRRTPGRAVLPVAVGSALFVGPVERPAYSLLETPQVHLDAEFWEQSDGGLWLVWDALEDLFPPGLLDAMWAGFGGLLTALAEGDAAWRAPDLGGPRVVPVSTRPVSTRPVPDGLLHDGLRRQAAVRPDAVAVRTPTSTLTYGALRRRVLGVAATLREQGVRPGDRVAVVLPKGAAQVVAVLAVLTVGAVYVPVEPAWPLARRQELLSVTRAALTSDASPSSTVDIPVDRSATEPAYVIYTSGSTGRPKGAVLDHRGPLNTIADVNARFEVGPGDTVFGLSALSFDLSVYDIFGSLHAGATLVLPGPGEADPAAWVQLMREYGVSVVNCVPALTRLVVDAAETAGVTLPELRLVLLSGDWIPVGLPRRIRTVAPNATVVSLGGATEASIWSIAHVVEDKDADRPSIPYGRPLANQTWHVLDPLGRDCPVWTPGELCIGGVGVAQGYLNDPARTALSFVPHPSTGQRLYRTGDLGRYLPDGTIELLGRLDQQVKVHGYRVEPGEVEHALAACPGVRQAVVVGRESAGGRQLAAYVTGDAGLAPEALRASLARRLPGHLVPAVVTVLDELPRTANGKVDRRALAQVAPEPVGRARVAPRTAVEAALVDVWRAVLGVERVGVYDDFFDLGGQSFAALRAVTRIGDRFGRRVPVGALLEHRTVAGLAAWLAADDAWSPLVRLRDGADPWFLVHPAGGDVQCYRALAELCDEGCFALQAPARPAESVAELVDLYLPAVLDARPVGPYRLGGWSSGAVIALELAHRLEQRGQEVARLAVLDAPAPVHPRPVDEAELAGWFAADLAPGPASELASTFAVYRGVVRACWSYQAPRVAAPITVVRATEGTVREFASSPAADPDWGWSTLTNNRVAVHHVDGSHHTILTGRRVQAVRDALTAR